MPSTIFGRSVSSDLWSAIPQRTETNRLSLERLNIPKQFAVTFFTIDWLSSVEQFRKEEQNFLDKDGEFESKLDEHRAVISQLIAQGEALLLAIKKDGLVEDAEFTREDVAATISLLRDTFRGVHGPHNHPEVNKGIITLFG
jgi:hypothetical protein